MGLSRGLGVLLSAMKLAKKLNEYREIWISDLARWEASNPMEPQRQTRKETEPREGPQLDLSRRQDPLPSQTVMIWPGISALSRAFESVGGTNWNAVNANQSRWLGLLEFAKADLQKFAPGELESEWGRTAEDINRFLASRGFPDLQLSPWPDNLRNFGVAAVQQLRLEWLQVGSQAHIEKGESEMFMAIHLKDGAKPRFCEVESFDNPVVEIPLKGDQGDTLLVTEHPQSRGFNLLNIGMRLRMEARSAAATPLDYGEVMMPEVNLIRRPNMEWLVGLGITDSASDPWAVTQAIQEDRFSMDRKGVVAEAAFAASVRYRACVQIPKPILEINNPFLAVVVRRDVALPLAVAWLNYDSWVKC